MLRAPQALVPSKVDSDGTQSFGFGIPQFPHPRMLFPSLQMTNDFAKVALAACLRYKGLNTTPPSWIHLNIASLQNPLEVNTAQLQLELDHRC